MIRHMKVLSIQLEKKWLHIACNMLRLHAIWENTQHSTAMQCTTHNRISQNITEYHSRSHHSSRSHHITAPNKQRWIHTLRNSVSGSVSFLGADCSSKANIVAGDSSWSQNLRIFVNCAAGSDVEFATDLKQVAGIINEREQKLIDVMCWG